MPPGPSGGGDRAGGSRTHVPAILLAVTAACAVAVVVSPGNTVRQALYATVHHRFLYSAGMTALQTLRFSVDWVSERCVAARDRTVRAVGREVGASPGAAALAPPLVADLAVVAGLLLVIPAAVFPAYWETGILGTASNRQHRLFRVPGAVVHRDGRSGWPPDGRTRPARYVSSATSFVCRSRSCCSRPSRSPTTATRSGSTSCPAVWRTSVAR